MEEALTDSGASLDLLECARARIRSVLATIRSLKQGEFPTTDAQFALDALKQLFDEDLTVLCSLDESNNPGVVKQACSTSLGHVFSFMPFLGFILRSTNVRNSFELYRPLLQLAKTLLVQGSAPGESQDPRLILSSEWDYCPYTYTEMDDDTGRDYLQNFVLIGLPASEAENPLLVPLAGHELGHSVWRRRNL